MGRTSKGLAEKPFFGRGQTQPRCKGVGTAHESSMALKSDASIAMATGGRRRSSCGRHQSGPCEVPTLVFFTCACTWEALILGKVHLEVTTLSNMDGCKGLSSVPSWISCQAASRDRHWSAGQVNDSPLCWSRCSLGLAPLSMRRERELLPFFRFSALFHSARLPAIRLILSAFMALRTLLSRASTTVCGCTSVAGAGMGRTSLSKGGGLVTLLPIETTTGECTPVPAREQTRNAVILRKRAGVHNPLSMADACEQEWHVAGWAAPSKESVAPMSKRSPLD
eukprot:2054086-Amphidinium_carterae.1